MSRYRLEASFLCSPYPRPSASMFRYLAHSEILDRNSFVLVRKLRAR